jgi:hypothetical protein
VIESEPPTGGETVPGREQRRGERYIGIAAIAVGLIATMLALRLGLHSNLGGLGPGALPLVIGIGLILSGVVVFIQTALHNATDPGESGPSGNAGWSENKSSMMNFALIALLAVALPWIGYLVATTGYVCIATWGRSRRKILTAIAYSVVIVGVTYLLFAKLFAVPVPVGSLFGGVV